MTYLVVVDGKVTNEAADELQAKSLAEQQAATSGGCVRVAKVYGECRARHVPEWAAGASFELPAVPTTTKVSFK